MKKNVLVKAFCTGLITLVLYATVQAQVTTNGGSGLAATYDSLKTAIAALNAATITSPVIITLDAGNPQSVPASGYVINAEGTSTNTITIVGNGNTLTASAGLTAGVLNDAIIKIIGGDYITIDNFILTENAANTNTTPASNNMIEWGVALLHLTTINGSQNNTIKNCTIDLNRTYTNTFGIYNNTNHTPTTISTADITSTAAGANSNMKVIGCTITDVNIGIVVIGSSFLATETDGLTIGGSALEGNTISNFGGASPLSGYFNVSGTVNGILIRFVKNITVSYNTITSAVGSSTNASLRGIYVPAGTAGFTGTIVNNFNNNTISLSSAFTTGAIQGISIETNTGNSTTTININDNEITNLNHSVVASGAITGIINAMAALEVNMNNNSFTNLTTNTTGSFTFLQNSITMPAGGSQTVNGNQIVTGFSKTGAGGSLILFTSSANSPTGTTSTNSNNNFSNITITGATTNGGWINRDGATTINGPTKTITNNTFNNWTNGTSSVIVINENAGSPTSIISGNNINNITASGTVTGISILSNSNATLKENLVYSISSSGAALVTGISVTGTANANNTPRIVRNKVYDLQANNAGGTVNGILIGLLGTVPATAAEVTVANNLIGDLKAPISSNTSDAVRGISINAATPAITSKINVYFNTVLLNASSSGTNFSTAGIFHTTSSTATTSSLDFRNNIIINNSVASGTGTTAAFRRSAAALDNYATTSNNNILYAGIPSATNVIYSDGVAYQTIADFKTLVSTRETASATENTTFLSTMGASADFLHINLSATTLAKDAALPIAGITDDYDGDTRSATPDIGADEFAGSPLPISIKNFTGIRQANDIVLQWTTATEINNKGFEVLRSEDGIHYSPLLFVATKAANGNSNGSIAYDVTDTKPFASSNYYRLKQIDKDGKTTLSNVVVLKGKKTTQLQLVTLYPNPVISNLNVVIASEKAAQVTLAVTAINGKMMLQQQEAIVMGETNISLPLSTLVKGQYIITVRNNQNGETAQHKIIKQ